ncbi:hypothetical protein FRC04_004324 [Tulasnella sp. 424]|nr:hypothetical protein FRC04_004324 [Tulasnella sp. 424]KAG8979441.1 hypothetical protein FRC05_008427 [Tulasnella sp. 425]
MLMRLAAGLLAAASTAYAAHNITVLNNATTGSGGWKDFTNCGGTKYTYDLGGFFNFNFVGTGIFVVGTASLEGGIVTFNVDGTTATFDRYSAPPYKCGVLLFGKGGLSNTTHSLTATLSGPSPANATQSPFFEFQFLQYTQLDVGDTLSSSSDLPASGTTATATGAASGAPQQPASGGGVSGGAIGGGIAAGIIGLGIIGFVIWFCVRREKREKAAAAAASPRPEIDRDPPRQSFMYSPVGVSGYGRLSHDGGAGGDRRRSINTAAPWIPDAHVAANLAPQSDSSGTHYPPGAAAPSVIHSSSQSSGSSPQQTYSSGYTVQNPAPGAQPSMMGASGLPESEVERIAARVASMMHPPPPPPPGAQAGRPPKGGAPPPMHQAIQEAYEDQPPPMYEPRRNP